MRIPIHTYIHTYVYIYIYIYIHREREREREESAARVVEVGDFKEAAVYAVLKETSLYKGYCIIILSIYHYCRS